jgi:hypothetical protein
MSFASQAPEATLIVIAKNFLPKFFVQNYWFLDATKLAFYEGGFVTKCDLVIYSALRKTH